MKKIQMRARTILKSIAATAIVLAVFWGLFLYYAFAAIMGVLGVPHIYQSRVPLPDNAAIVIQAVGETAYRSYGYQLEASYHPSAMRSSWEEIGKWHGDAYLPATYVLEKLILFVPEPSQMFVRTETGKWKQFWMYSITDSNTGLMDAADQSKMLNDLGIDRGKEAVRFEIRYFSAERNELVADVKTSGGILRGRLFCRLSDDGEKLRLLRAQKVEKHSEPQPDSPKPR